MKKFFAAVFGLLLFFCSICNAYAPEGKLFVTMLDVGQGDAFLIETSTQNILIDTGDVPARPKLVSQLQRIGIKRIERIILTHAHSDHIGGVKAVVENFPVDEISDNGFISSNPLYRKYHEADVKFSVLQAGDIVDFGGGVSFKIFSPNPILSYNSVNNQSIVGKLIFGEFSMLFTGDADQLLEKTLLKKIFAPMFSRRVITVRRRAIQDDSFTPSRLIMFSSARPAIIISGTLTAAPLKFSTIMSKIIFFARRLTGV